MLSLTMMAIPFGLVFWAEQHVVSSMAAILYAALPLVVSMFTSIFMNQKVPRRAVLAMVVAFGGLVALLYSEPSTSRLALLSYGALLTAMTLAAWSVVYAKQRLRHVNPVVSTGLQLFFGSIALGWATWALESHRHAVWTRPAFAALAFLTVVGSCIAFVVYYWLLKHMQPYQIGTANLVIPVIAVFEGWLRGEAVRWMMMLVVVIILASVAAALRAEEHAGSEIEVLALRDAAE
jgi:drug/metabolite transporter (DMT)-like permease